MTISLAGQITDKRGNGMNGVTVKAIPSGSSTPTSTTRSATTNGVTGYWSFAGLADGTYDVQVETPMGFTRQYALSQVQFNQITVGANKAVLDPNGNLTLAGNLDVKGGLIDVYGVSGTEPFSGVLEGNVVGTNDSFRTGLSLNAKQQPNGVWNYIDNTKNAWLWLLDANGGLNAYYAAASPGTTQIAAFQNPFRLFNSGGLYLGLSPIDPGANNLQVQGSIVAKASASLISRIYVDGSATSGGKAWNIESGGGDGPTLIVSNMTDLIQSTFFHGTGGVSIGTGTDPGATNLLVQGTVQVTGGLQFNGASQQVGWAGGAHVTSNGTNDLLLAAGTTSSWIYFYAASKYLAVIDNGANLKLGTTQSPAYGNSIVIANAPAAPNTPTSAGVIYVDAGALKYRGSSGTITVLASA